MHDTRGCDGFSRVKGFSPRKVSAACESTGKKRVYVKLTSGVIGHPVCISAITIGIGTAGATRADATPVPHYLCKFAAAPN